MPTGRRSTTSDSAGHGRLYASNIAQQKFMIVWQVLLEGTQLN
jgi:hypothetical protein